MGLLTLFDIDGTLLDAGGAGRVAVEVALVEVYGTAGPIDELSFAGLTDPYIARVLMRHAGFDDAEIDARFERLWEVYVRELGAVVGDGRVRIHTGAVALLDELERRGATMGLVTGNVERGAHHKLSACGLADRFAFGSYGSDAENRDELPEIAIERASELTGREYDRDRTWIIGDTPRDVACAHAAGVRVLGVGTGSFTAAQLVEAGADHGLADLSDTGAILELFGESRAEPGRARFAT